MPKKVVLYKWFALVAVLLPCFLVSVQAFGQTLSSLSGTVQDATKGVLPGATVTATNTATGVATTTITNNAGVYNMPALQPGTYRVSAQMNGFQTNIVTGVKLDVASQVRFNFELAIAGVSSQVEISTSADNLLLESSSTTGAVLTQDNVAKLPLLGNNIMELSNIMGGVVRQEDSIFYNDQQSFAGVKGGNINIQRDGVTVSDARYSSGIVSPSRLNPEMVSEFKMVLTPVDAEMGRGAGQVQVLTKSGTNTFHGSGVWSNLNTGIDANEWDNNRTGTGIDYSNVNEYTITVGGPLIKNKTFFFGSWNQNIVRMRSTVRTPVLTNCARKGIFRYFDGWIGANTQTSISRTANAQTRPVTDSQGNPLVPTDNVNGTPYSGVGTVPSYQGLNYFSVLGQLTPSARQQVLADPVNCSAYAPNGLSYDASLATQQGFNGIVAGSSWDTHRLGYDSSGYISRFSALMPVANDFYGGGSASWGDGLNVADHKWTRTTPGKDTVYGTGYDNQRRSLNFKIDHNISSNHKLSGAYSYEADDATAADQTWPMPNGFPGSTLRNPQTFSLNYTATLRPTLLNEFRFGLAYNWMHSEDPMTGIYGTQMKELLQKLLPTSDWPDWKSMPVVVGPGAYRTLFSPDTYIAQTPSETAVIATPIAASNPYGSRNWYQITWGGEDKRWTWGDTMTWVKGSHSFRFGGEYRWTRIGQQGNGTQGATWRSSGTTPFVLGGDGGIDTAAAAGFQNISGLVGTTKQGLNPTGSYQQAYNLLSYLSGSVGELRQWYFVNSAKNLSWNDPAKGELNQDLPILQREFSFFFKDDWKIANNLTLNLGIRYDYYGVPWVDRGMTVGLEGGSQSLFGGSQGGFSNWLQNNASYDASKETVLQFIGPDSPHPDQSAYNKDLNNFGPAIGFAWQLPWLGKGKTTVRGGYQASFVPVAAGASFAGIIGGATGTVYQAIYHGDANVRDGYMDMSMVRDMIPITKVPAIQAQNIQPLQKRTPSSRVGSVALSVFDPNVRSPYIQSLTLAVTRNIGSFLTADVRYIGTLSRKQLGGTNLNSVNFVNNGLRDAFDLARAGLESPLLDKLILPKTLTATGMTGASQLRASTTTLRALAIGDYASLASALAATNGVLKLPSTVSGGVLRNSGTPENFILTNPQYSSANWNANLDNSNYHSMQTQITLRPTHGLSFQASYTWSKNLGYMGTVTDPLNRALDYGILSTNRPHNFSTYGQYTLPFGPNGYLFRNSTGLKQKFVEGWNLSWISYLYSGVPSSITTTNSMWANGQPDLVRAELFSRDSGHVVWPDGARYGQYYARQDGTPLYTRVADPQCDSVASSLKATCQTSLYALAYVNPDGSTGPVVFQHPQPGVRGNFAANQLQAQGRWGMDMSASKSVQFMEGKSFTLRFDIKNVFNHATPSNGNTTYNSRDYNVSGPSLGNTSNTSPFGSLYYKTGHRVFSAKLQVNF